MFMLDAQLSLMRAWTEAAQANLRLFTTPWPANPWSMGPWSMGPWSMPSTGATNPWMAGNPWMTGSAWPMPFVQAAWTPASFPMWCWPVPYAGFAPSPQIFNAWMSAPMAWSAAAAQLWSFAPRPTTTNWTPAASYRSAGGHATAAIVTPADLARTLSNFWTASVPSARKLH
jgi:hypothetical protein